MVRSPLSKLWRRCLNAMFTTFFKSLDVHPVCQVHIFSMLLPNSNYTFPYFQNIHHMFVSRLILLERLWNIMVYQRVASRLTYCSLVFIDWLSIEIFTCMYNTLLVQNAVHKSQVIEPDAGAILAHSNYAAVTMCPVMCHTGRAAHIQKTFAFLARWLWL